MKYKILKQPRIYFSSEEVFPINCYKHVSPFHWM